MEPLSQREAGLMATSSRRLHLTAQEEVKTMKTTMIAILLVAGISSAAEVDQRQRNQQQRIAQGGRSGSLTPAETARLERKEAAVRREIHHGRVVNGGHLTPAQKARVNRQETRISNQIYRAKHN
jgi:hypothetical protein